MFPQNSERVQRQKKTPITVIMSNPPYSVGQKSADDNAQNLEYPKLDNRISEIYQAIAPGTGKRALYDAYIKAFRWSTDRLDKTSGIICFVSNGSWLEGIATAGFRLSIEKEFTSIYVFNLRGNCRTSGELRQREAGNVFGLGSRTPISITLLVKKQENQSNRASIYYYNIGDYHTRERKLDIIKKFRTTTNIPWIALMPNKYGDWINLRNNSFQDYIALGEKNNKETNSELTFFKGVFSFGLLTARDSWLWNYNKIELENNVKKTIKFYTQELDRFNEAKKDNPNIQAKNFITIDTKKISWDNRRLIGGIDGNKNIIFNGIKLRTGLYRPFCKQHIYFSLQVSHSLYLQKDYFPTQDSYNLIICTSVPGSTSDFSALISNKIVEYSMGQCFPLYYYEENNTKQKNLFDTESNDDYIRHDAISDFILERCRKQYGKNVTKEDIFYFVYGFLHSPQYRETFAADLKKMLPRLPLPSML